MSNLQNKSNNESIDEKLMGLEINDGSKNYGVICRIDKVNNSFKVYTTLGHSFNAGLILNLLAISNLYDETEQKAKNNTNDKVKHLAPAYIENAKLSRKIMSRPKPMAHSKELRSNGNINNVAQVSKDESIVITSYISNADSFPEDIPYNKVKAKTGLTIDEICEREGISVNEYFENRKGNNNEQ